LVATRSIERGLVKTAIEQLAFATVKFDQQRIAEIVIDLPFIDYLDRFARTEELAEPCYILDYNQGRSHCSSPYSCSQFSQLH